MKTLLDTLSLLATFFLIGWLVSVVIFPEKQGLATRLKLSVAISAMATVFLALPGMALGGLGIITFVITAGVLVIVAGWRVRGHWSLHLNHRTLPVTKITWTRSGEVLVKAAATLAALILGWVSVFGPEAAGSLRNGIPARSSSWYYWALIKKAIAHGGFPKNIGEWGAQHSFPEEYASGTIHAAITADIAHNVTPLFLNHYSLFEIGVLLVALWALWSRWLPSWWAWMAALLVATEPYIQRKLISYVPEMFGLILVVWSAWLLDEALERRSIRFATLAGLTSASAFLAHAEVWLITVPLWVGVLLSRVVPYTLSHWRDLSHDLKTLASRCPGNLTARVALVILSLGLSFGLGLGVEGSIAGGLQRFTSILALNHKQSAVSVPQIGKDPTWALTNALSFPERTRSNPPNLCATILRKALNNRLRPGITLKNGIVRLTVGLGVLLVLLALPFTPPAARRYLIVWVVFAAGLYSIIWAMCHVYHTFVPLKAATRLQNYDGFAVTAFFVGLAWLGTSALSRGFTSLWKRPYKQSLAAGVISVAVAVVAIAFVSKILLLPYTYSKQTVHVNMSIYHAMTWMSRNLPADSVVMANGYTPGTIMAVAGDNGWLDGRVPYLESPQWRYEATKRLIDTRAYFKHPLSYNYGPPPRVQYLLVAYTGGNGWGLSFEVNRAELQQARNIHPIKAFGKGDVYIFKVIHPQS